MRRIILAGLAVMALAAPASASPLATGLETPGTAPAQKQMEVASSITDADEYLAFVKSLADYDHARDLGDKH